MDYKSKLGIATFFAIAFGIPWTGWFFVEDANLHLWLFPLFASLAGFAAAFAEGGKNGLKDFSVRVFSIVPALPYVLIGLVLPLSLGLTYLFVKGVPIFAMPWSPAAILALSLGAALITGPIAEEFGWRGYLQHRLLGRFSPFWVALLISVIWWMWHFPLYRTSHFASFNSAFNFFVYLLTWSIFMVFLVQRAGGSVWPAVILHWAANTHPNVMQSLLPEVDGGFLPGGSKGALFYLSVACVFLAVKRRFFFDSASIKVLGNLFRKLYALLKLIVVLFFIAFILLGLRMYFWKPDVCGSRELWQKGVQTTSRQIDGAKYPGTRLHGEHTIYDGYLTYNKTQVLDCDDETDLSVVRRYLYIEYRDPELHKDLKDVLKRETQSPELSTLFHAAGFRFLPLNFEYQCPLSGELDKATLLGDCKGIREKFLAWDPKFVLKHAPTWLPQEQLKAETFIAFYGEGSLFQGKESNQYFWVSF